MWNFLIRNRNLKKALPAKILASFSGTKERRENLTLLRYAEDQCPASDEKSDSGWLWYLESGSGLLNYPDRVALRFTSSIGCDLSISAIETFVS